MAIRAEAEARQTYLVEHYRPGCPVEALREWAARVQASADGMESEGKAIHYLRSTIVPADESLLCVLEASCDELVREAFTRAGVRFERLSTAISVEVETPSHDHPPAPAVQDGSHPNSTRGARNDR